MIRRILAALVLVPSLAIAQAAPNTSLALISYGALKNRIKPQGELAAQIASLDTAIRIAQLRGETAQVRRWIAKGTALLNGRVWADTSDYRQSLVLRSEHVFVDPSVPYGVRLEQTYAPSIEGLANLTAVASIRAGAIATTPGRVLTKPVDVARDLRDTPLRMDLDLAGAPDGEYLVDVTVSDSTRELGGARIRIVVVSRLAARLKSLDSAANSAPAELKADIRYPADYVRKIDRGIIPVGNFDLVTELASAEAIASAVSREPRAESPSRTEREVSSATISSRAPAK